MSLSDKIEDRQDALLAEHDAGREKLREIMVRFIAEVGALDFPLGWPVRCYDQESVLDQIVEMTPSASNQPDAVALREMACQKAQDELAT